MLCSISVGLKVLAFQDQNSFLYLVEILIWFNSSTELFVRLVVYLTSIY